MLDLRCLVPCHVDLGCFERSNNNNNNNNNIIIILFIYIAIKSNIVDTLIFRPFQL